MNIIDFPMIYYDFSDITASYISKITTFSRLHHNSATKPNRLKQKQKEKN